MTCTVSPAHEKFVVQIIRRKLLCAIEQAASAPKGSAQVAMGEATGCLPLGSLIDLGAENARLAKALAGIESDMGKLSAKLGNERFVANAKPEVVEADRERLAALTAEQATVKAAMARLAEL